MDIQPPGEFHHFQLVDQNGQIPLSVSVLVHFNRERQKAPFQQPISDDDIIHFHFALKAFDGNFAGAFNR